MAAAAQKTLNSATVKFLCSYGGKILPRPSDGRLRYSGGLTRVVSVHRHVSFSELMAKLTDLCGFSMTLRCQLPNEDLDVLVSIKSDEDLANVMEEYDRASLTSGKDLKIRVILSPPKSSASSSPDSSASSFSSSADLSPPGSLRQTVIPPLRRLTARKQPCGAVREFYNRYPCHLQANSPRHPSYFSQHQYNQWN